MKIIRMRKPYAVPMLALACIVLFIVMNPLLFRAEPDILATSAILIDASSGEVLYSKNENMPLAPASMSKLMTEYIVLENIENGEISWNDKVTISDTAAATGGATVQLQPGEKISVRDLFVAMTLASANNAAVQLAEYVSGTEREFTALMNEKAKKLGLSEQTLFRNATGLPNPNHEETTMTAHDVATLSIKLLDRFPEVLEITKLPSYQLDYHGTIIQTTNAMLYSDHPSLNFEGLDGLKTGYTINAGYCFAGTARQGDTRVVSVVMGTSTIDQRFQETRELLAYGFGESPVTVKYLAKMALFKVERVMGSFL